jgi:predicted glycosyltransferase
VKFTLDEYFYNYHSRAGITDMPQRAYHYRRLINILSNINSFSDQVYVVNDKNYIKIDNICVVEFEIRKHVPEVAIMNIQFNNDITQPQKYNP